MEQKILNHLDLINQSIDWVKDSLEGEKQNAAYRNLAFFRRQLKKKKFAMEGNPAAAMYGESQAGKSYLVSALLSSKGNPFKVMDGAGNEFDFKAQINPRGNEMESTSVVTRFSTTYKSINDRYPVIAKTLSPVDIVLIICEAYYNNLSVNTTLSFDEIKERVDALETKYRASHESQLIITEDDILDIGDYFNDNFSKLEYNNIKDAAYFEKVGSLIARVAPEEWSVVFALLWNSNPQLTKLFEDLIQQFKLIDFADTVYLPIEAVLREKGTLLDVSRLDEIYGPFKGQETGYTPNTPILYRSSNGNEIETSFSKPFLCALTAEIIFVLPSSFSNDKPFLNHTDLLDFPGTRRFENTNENNITDNSLTVLLRRGRVDYLFNKYSNNERINVLMFCQNHKQSNQSVMPEKLNRWIETMIGKNPIEREMFESPISPLFVISTWFNKDLEYDPITDKQGDIQSLNERWNQRFSRTLEKEIFKIDTYPWLIDWTQRNPNFQNIYLLRDFDKSSEWNSKIYRGYPDYKEEKEEVKPDSYPTFREDLKKSFIEYPFVKQHFENPAISWEEAADMNKDGTKLIIERLTIAAEHINHARREKTIVKLNDILGHLLDELLKYFHTSDKDIELQKAKTIAGDIQHRLDCAFNADGIKLFGKVMKEIMLEEVAVLDLYRKTIDDIEHRDVVNMDRYSNYRLQVPVMENDTASTYFDRLAEHYEKRTNEERSDFHKELSARGVDLDALVAGNSDVIKNNAQQLAEALIEYWIACVTLSDKHAIQKVLGGDGSTALQEVTSMFQKLFKKLHITKRIAEKIRRYVDDQGKTDLPLEIVSDMSAEMLNRCLNTVGFDYYEESEVNDLRIANEKNRLGLVIEQQNSPMERTVEDLFIKIDNLPELIQSNPEEMKTLPSYRNYLSWYHRLKMGFIYVCDIPSYNVLANEKLGTLIKECKRITY